MRRIALKPLSLALALAGLAPLASPAVAGGQVSWSIAPADRAMPDVWRRESGSPSGIRR